MPVSGGFKGVAKCLLPVLLAVSLAAGTVAKGEDAQSWAKAHLAELVERSNDSMGFIRELVEDHESIIEFIRGNINPFANDYHDLGTSDFITGLMEDHEKMAWMLRSHLK